MSSSMAFCFARSTLGDKKVRLASVMQRAVISLFIAALVAWIGAAVFFSLVVLPSLFINLETARAGEVAALLFPRYFQFGTAAGLLLLASSSYMARGGEPRWQVAAIVVAVMLACQLYSTFVVHPQIAELRGIESMKAAFDSLHKLSVRLNAVVLLGGIGLVAGSGVLFERR